MSSSHEEGLLRHGLLLMVFQQVGNASTIGFQVVAGRALGPVEYPILIALLGVVMTFGYPMDALRTSFAHFSARLDREGRRDEIQTLLRRWFGYLAAIGVGFVALGWLGDDFFASRLHVPAGGPFILTIVILAGSLFIPVLAGALQGIQSFGWFAATCHIWGVVRFLAVVALFYAVGKTTTVGLVSQLMAVGVTVCVGIVGLKCVLGRGRADVEPIPGVMTYAISSVAFLFSFSVLMSFDVVLAQAYFPEDSDNYSRASTVGRSVIFFAQPIVMAMFPKVASKGEATGKNWQNLLRALLYSMLAIVPLVGVVMLFPQIPIWVLYGKDYITPEVLQYTRWVLLAMSPLGIVFLLMNFQLAQHRFRPLIPLLLCAAGFYFFVLFFHEDLSQLIVALGVASSMALVSLVAGLPWKSFVLTDEAVEEEIAATSELL